MSTNRNKRILIMFAMLATASCALADGNASGTPTASPVVKPQASSDWLGIGDSLASKEAGNQAVELSREAAETDHAKNASGGPRIVPWVDYTGDMWHRAAMTGDWGGVRQKMMDNGLRVNVYLTQALQGNLEGGTNGSAGPGNKPSRAYYNGVLRYEVDLDTGAAGLWPGGWFHVRGETPYGHNDNSYSGGILPVNDNALYPAMGQNITCLSDAYYVQFLSSWFGVLAGKMELSESNVFASDDTSQFMNSAFNWNPIIGTTIPLDCMAAGVLLHPIDWFSIKTLVLDTDGKANVSGFNSAFERGTTVTQEAEIMIKPFGLAGHQRFGWAWTDKTHMELRQDNQLIFRGIVLEKLGLGPGPAPATRSSDWCIKYDFDQYIYTKPGTTDQGIGVFGRFGYSDGVVNPIGQFYSLGVGGKGMVPGRDNDTFGVGYYYLDTSDKLGTVLGQLAQDEQGVEMYYNIEITPWLHVSPDIQIIEPGRKRFDDTAVVAGTRMKIDF